MIAFVIVRLRDSSTLCRKCRRPTIIVTFTAQTHSVCISCWSSRFHFVGLLCGLASGMYRSWHNSPWGFSEGHRRCNDADQFARRRLSFTDSVVARMKTKFRETVFCIAGLSVCNSLPEFIRPTYCTVSFKGRLKSHFLVYFSSGMSWLLNVFRWLLYWKASLATCMHALTNFWWTDQQTDWLTLLRTCLHKR